ncbi:MAG: bifunctional diaminohydroxyphosphoribosylaminopyrimidine deaminase/5-amino-6-(5-phosphoribosylamino)uracil reductase RibD [Planctomycetota bacterium]
MEFQSEDDRWMELALELAASGQGHVEPNPMVGCVLVRDGESIGSGYHRAFGGPHAEVEALRSVRVDPRGATAYVTLEPCSHFGKTPPCCDALIEAKVNRVVIGMADPFSEVNGEGIQRLRDAGIEVSVDVLSDRCRELNAPYLKRLARQRPWVIGKWAMTADGRIATRSGQSQWISGEASRRRVHELRGRVDAIVVGMGTVTADDPMLTARLVDDDGNQVSPARIAKRIVACHHHTPSLDSQLVKTARDFPTHLLIHPTTPANELDALRSTGVEIHRCRSTAPIAFIDEVLGHLCELGSTNVMIEGGPKLLASLLGESNCLLDELHVYVGAKVFGGAEAPGPIGGVGISELASAPTLSLHEVERLGEDVRMIYRVNSA